MSEPTAPPLIEGFTLGPFATNCYLVRDPGNRVCWIVDASFQPQEMIERVRELGVDVAAIILTHAHVDHIAGLADIKTAFPDSPILIHEAEREWPGDPVKNLSAPMGESITGPAPDKLLKGGESLELGESAWRVAHTPGHSPGGIILYNAAARAAIVGDTLFAGSIGRSDFPGSDEQTLHRSIRESLYTLPDETRVYPGHGPATTIGMEKRTNPYVRA